MKQLIFLILILLNIFLTTKGQSNSVVLNGKVIDRESSSIRLVKSTQDLRYHGKDIAISESGEFVYSMTRPEIMEEYSLVFIDEWSKGRWRSIRFYPDNDTIHFTLHAIDLFAQNKISGSELTNHARTYEQKLSDTFEKKFENLYLQMDSIKQINPNSTQIAVIGNKINTLYKDAVNWRITYFKDHLDITSYVQFLQLARQKEDFNVPQQSLEELYSLFSQKFPNHPYTRIVTNILYGAKVGGQFVDFTAPDSTGTNISISSLIPKNKITLIDLWAPWCGPCIKKSKEVQKVFPELNNKGLEIIAVIGGVENEEQYYNALRKYNYPWIVLMEVKDQNLIWEKYNINNSGGSQFLIDTKGEIIAVNPSIGEIRDFLKKL